MSHNERHDRPLKSAEFDCKDVAAVLSGLLDDEVTVEVRHAAERHIAHCRTCAATIDQGERLDLLLDEYSSANASLPDGFIDAVLARTAPDVIRRPLLWRWVAASGWLMAAASITLAVIFWSNLDPQLGRSATEEFAQNDTSRFETSRHTDRAANSTAAHPRPVFDNNPPGAGPTTRVQYTRRPEAISDVDESYLPPLGPPALNDEAGISRSADSRIITPRRDDAARINLGMDQFSADRGPAEFHAAALHRTLLTRDDEELLYAVSYLLEAVASEADETTLRTAEDIRRQVEYDRILERLEKARERLSPQDRATVLAAESILFRIAFGPVNLDDWRLMRQTVRELNLISEVSRMTGIGDPDRTM